jgi:hypothetical protein
MARYKAVQERPFKDPEVEVLREAIPEANLWIAVIDQALADLSSQSQRAAAARWVESDRCDPGSFRWACDLLDLNVNAVRAALSRTRG